MPISYSEHVPLICPNCRGDFSDEIWLVLDAHEQPEQTEALRTGRLNLVTCPHCGHTGPAGAPLLFHDGPARCVVFAAAPGAAEHVWREQARELHALLVEQFPLEERRPYLEDVQIAQDVHGIAHILGKRARKRIPAPPSAPVVSREPVAAELPVAPPAAEDLLLREAIAALLRVNSLQELHALVKAQPILLTAAADRSLVQLADVAIEERNYAMSEGVWQVRRVLADIRAGGTGQPVEQPPPAESAPAPAPVPAPEHPAVLPELPDVAQQALLRAETAPALVQVVQDYPLLQEHWVDQILARQVELALDEGNDWLARALEERREALLELRQQYLIGAQQRAVREVVTVPYQVSPTPVEGNLEEALIALFAAEDEDLMAAVLLDFPVLLTDAAQQALGQLASNAEARGDDELAAYASQCRTMLHNVRNA